MTRAARLLLTSLAFLAPAALLAAPDVVFHGNEALIDPVLLDAMELPSGAHVTRAMAELGAANLKRFFRTTGYDLATVRVVARDGVLHVVVDEGKLERVVVHGQSSWRTVQVKLDLHLPGSVFNRLQLDREVQRLKAKYGLSELRWEVRETGNPEQAGMQLGDLESVPLELLWAREASRHELHLFAGDDGWGEGWGVGLALETPDGLRVDVSWSDASLLFSDDRYRLDTLVGGWLRESLDGGRLHPVLTRAQQRLRWLTPPIVGTWLRFDVLGLADVRNLQRADLALDAAWRYAVEASIGVSFEIVPRLELSASGGYQLDGVSQVALAKGAPSLGDASRTHPFVRGSLSAARDDPSLRLDRRHVVRLVAEDHGVFQGAHDYRLVVEASGGIERGWNELLVRGTAAWVGGPGVSWWDDVDVVGASFRLPPPALTYARRLAQLGLEGRLSLHRDFFKIGAFLDGSVHESGAVAGLPERRGLASAFGFSVHFLVLDAFEFDAYLGGVVDQDLELGQGVAIQFRKVY